MQGRRNPFVASEGLPFLIAATAAFGLAVRYLDISFAAAAGLLFLVLVLIFRDPHRPIPASPLGVVSPVDGRIISVDRTDKGILHGGAQRIHIQIDSFGTYTARAPVEGKIMDLRSVDGAGISADRSNGLWLQTDEGDDVVLQFHGYRFGLAPRSFIGIGERVGQGQRCAYLRLTRIAELHLPIDSNVLVEPGQIVVAGTDLVGKVPHP